MISLRLRAETKDAHLALEKAMIPFLKASVDRESYVYLLRTMQVYLFAVESAVVPVISSTLLPDKEERRSARKLTDDIEALGYSASDVANYATVQIPQDLNFTPRAWGALYVLEGSTLGGQVVSGMLQRQLSVSDQAISYFNGYGEQTASRWVVFQDAINQYATEQPQYQDDIIAGAVDTFDCFRKWLCAVENSVTT
jgi:heme oxygenase